MEVPLGNALKGLASLTILYVQSDADCGVYRLPNDLLACIKHLTRLCAVGLRDMRVAPEQASILAGLPQLSHLAALALCNGWTFTRAQLSRGMQMNM